jgi:hypothetical protein
MYHPKIIITMKKIISSIVTVCSLLSLQSSAQIYGEAYLQHNATLLSSAEVALTFPGYLMAGYSSISSGLSPNFVIDKPDNLLNFTSPNDFSRAYEIWDDISCSNASRIFNCGGVSVVETNMGGNAVYALTGAYNEGVFFATLDAQGVPLNTYRWVFPGTASIYGTPKIRESVVAGEFYICGYFDQKSYVMKVNANALPVFSIWANIYDNQFTLEARDLIESPHNPQELIVVGRTDIRNAPPGAKGFFKSLDRNNGSFNYMRYYSLSNAGSHWFSCIGAANDPSSPGFILGGRSLHQISSSGMNWHYQQWMAKLNPAGLIIWSHLIWPQGVTAGNNSGGEISGVFERLNTSGRYEYYGAATNFALSNGTARNNLTVYKLDGGGGISLNPNQFQYQWGDGMAPPGPGSVYDHARLTQINTGGPDDGFQVYGNNFTLTDHYFVKAYFNGVSSSAGCETRSNIQQVFPGPVFLGFHTPTITSFNQSCQAIFSLQNYALNTPVSSPCGGLVPSVPGGSNARPLVTGLSGHDVSSGLEIFPNPVSDKAIIRFAHNTLETVEVKVFNTLGQKVEVPFRPNGNGHGELDFSAADCPPGIYFLNVESGAEILKTRIIYEKR